MSRDLTSWMEAPRRDLRAIVSQEIWASLPLTVAELIRAELVLHYVARFHPTVPPEDAHA